MAQQGKTTKKNSSTSSSTKKSASTRKRKSAAKTKATTPPEVTHDDIRQRAEEIYHERLQNGREGNAESDWLEAERQLHQQRESQTVASGNT